MDKSEEEKNQIKLPLEVADPNKKIPNLPDVVLRIIFRQLNGRDLSSATMVCRNWRLAADHEKRLRGPCCFIEDILDSQGDWNLDCIKELPIKPIIAFLFIHPYDTRKFSKMKDDIYKLLPKNCKTIVLFIYGLMYNEIKKDVEKLDSNILYALLPQIPNIQLNLFLRSKQNEDYTEYKQMIEEAFKQDESNGCLMIFCNQNCHCRMAEIAMSKRSKRFCLYGGMVNMLKTNTKKKKQYCVALLITGSIQTWSVITQQWLTPESVKEKLEIFKKQIKLQKHSMGFVFSNSTPPHMQNKIKIFKKVFPKVSLVGCYTVGATYGRDTITYKAELMPHDSDVLYISFMILTYGDYVE